METISMSVRDRKRLEVFSRVRSGLLSLVKAAELLAVSYRQVKRVWARYQAEGDSGLVHRLRGRASNRRPREEFKAQVLALYVERYPDYGPTLAAECLAQEDNLEVAVSTLRRWLSQAGLWERRRQRKAHRRRRPRREHLGELVQMDGSHHDWFEGRRGWAVLMVMIDDATGRVDACFFENESWESAARVFWEYLDRQGLPQALYVDRASIYRSDRDPTAAELLANQKPETEFGRAMRELGVELILAHSPEAKGRVERMNRTLQDRLVKALRRAGISDLAAANRFLRESYLPEFNPQFMVPPKKKSDLHRSLAKAVDLPRILSQQEQRVVQNDWTVRWRNAYLQLSRDSGVEPGAKVTVCDQLDGQVRLFAADRELSWTGNRTEPVPGPRAASGRGPTGSSQGQRPSPTHPWRGRGASLAGD